MKVPTLAHFTELKAEIQVRTVAQHIWAATSHVLQYKNESGVPLPVRRSINRVSALLEIVDLEFERVLLEKESYLATTSDTEAIGQLNVDLLRKVMDKLLPNANKEPTAEDYAELLNDLTHFKVLLVDDLKNIFPIHLEKALQEDRQRAEGIGEYEDFERAALGVFFTHCGLVRICLGHEVGEENLSSYIAKKYRERMGQK